ncbi:MAG: sulfotransferase domain-containing protein [Vicingaceae bacterium]
MMLKKKFKLLRYYLLRHLFNTHRETPIYIFGYHKSGTTLLGKIFKEICLKYGWQYKSVAGSFNQLPSADVVFFLHSQVDFSKLPQKYIGIHMVRDPRDIIISGYLYHKRTTEAWCTQKNFQTEKPIQYPQVPNSQMHRSEAWKKNYLKRLKPHSYQEKINSLNEEEGILFEMDHYGKWTLEDMLKWDFETANCLELKFEDIMADFNNEVMKIFWHCQLSDAQIKFAKRCSDKEDMNKMSSKAISKNSHISSANTSRWKKYFTKEIQTAFDANFKDVLKKYNY